MSRDTLASSVVRCCPCGAALHRRAHAHHTQALFADFVGAKHNVKLLPSGLGVSTRCADKNTVLLRSIKAAKLAAK